MSELRTYYGPTPRDPDPGKQWHYGCGGEILTFKDGEPTCTKCDAAANEQNSAQLGEEMREAVTDVADKVVTCTGTHPVQRIKYVGPLELFICQDPHCARIKAKCTHQIAIPENEDTKPRKFVKSTCEWNDEGTILTCTFCGRDGT